MGEKKEAWQNPKKMADLKDSRRINLITEITMTQSLIQTCLHTDN